MFMFCSTRHLKLTQARNQDFLLQAASNGVQKGRERPLDRCDRGPVSEGCVNVAAQVRRHLRAGFADNQNVALAFDADKVPGFKNDIVARRRNVALTPVDEVVVPGEKENSSNRACGRMFDLVEDRAPGDEVRLAVQHSRAETEQVSLDGLRSGV